MKNGGETTDEKEDPDPKSYSTGSNYKELNHSFLRELCEGICTIEKKCVLKELFVRKPPERRMAVQHLLIMALHERYGEEGCRLDMSEIAKLWIIEGYAARFAKHYREDSKIKELIEVVVGRKES